MSLIGSAFGFRSESLESYSLDIHVQDAHSPELIVSQIQYEDLFCDGRSKRRLLTHRDLARTQKVSQICFRGEAY